MLCPTCKKVFLESLPKEKESWSKEGFPNDYKNPQTKILVPGICRDYIAVGFNQCLKEIKANLGIEKEQEVYHYVKENAVEFMSLIISALNDGVKEENQKLREAKVKVEAGIVILADKARLSSIKTNLKSALMDALKSCTFFKVDSLLDKLK